MRCSLGLTCHGVKDYISPIYCPRSGAHPKEGPAESYLSPNQIGSKKKISKTVILRVVYDLPFNRNMTFKSVNGLAYWNFEELNRKTKEIRWKVKQTRYRHGQALRVPGVWGSQISRQSAHEWGKIVSPTHRPPLPPRKYSWYSFLLRGWYNPRAIVRPEWLCQMSPSGIEPATVRLVAQCLNQMCHRVIRPCN